MEQRRVRLFIATSLDGLIAGPAHEIDWLFTDQDYGYAAFIASVDTVLMGRRSYDVSCTFAEWPYPGLEVHVFSRMPPAPDPRVRFTAEPVGRVVSRLRATPGRDLWLLGGGELVGSFLDAGVVDEVVIGIHPLFLGGGIPLVPPGSRRTPLTLRDVQRFDSGLVILTYDRVE